jgi:hypothetical protein
LPFPNFGNRPAFKKRTENEAVGQCKKQCKKLFSNAEWLFATQDEPRRGEKDEVQIRKDFDCGERAALFRGGPGNLKRSHQLYYFSEPTTHLPTPPSAV